MSSSNAQAALEPGGGVHSIELGQLIFQGAESKVYHCSFYGAPALCKHRFVKRYRNPELDERLRTQRTRREARALERCVKKGIRAPRLLGADYINTFLVMSYEAGPTVKEALDAENAAYVQLASKAKNTSAQQKEQQLVPSPVTAALLQSIGIVVARLHNSNIVHGDLTTSNFICTCSGLAAAAPDADGADAVASTLSVLPTAEDIVVLDFGLISDKCSTEERAVDLYVLERAIASTHPYLSVFASDMILEGYRSAADPKKGEESLRRLEAVRARGRKRSMVG
ncbi:protein kinase, putative [Leishmania tarentolae]|uniref:non-specific serine/threonine protein kinase n=1 Tax=Leishmania tarentolae TaxID=5689 RepID=A0A640KIX8_LEITA|nr:protein kinase, putative [Leishmania tarentolae]